MNNLKINKAHVTALNKVLYVNQISDRSDFDEIKRDLKCATPDCPARICFVSSDTLNFLRTYPKDDHSKECKDFFERELKKSKQEEVELLEARLTQKDYQDRNKTFFNKLYSTHENIERKGIDKRSKVTSSEKESEPTLKIVVNPEGTGKEISKELSESNNKNIVGPRIKNRELHHIAITDKDSIIKSNGYIQSITIETDIRAVIEVKYKDQNAKYILSESFYNSGRVSAEIVNDYVHTLKRYIDKKERYPIQVITTCEVQVVSPQETHILYINDYAWLNFGVESAKNKFYTFPNLVAMITHNSL